MLHPKDLTERLGISAPTLRLWSTKFAAVLSPSAQASLTENGKPAQRRYTEGDLAYFVRAKTLLGDGLTYEQTLERLQAEPAPEVTDEVLNVAAQRAESDSTDVAVITDTHPIIAAFEEALRAKDETIQALQRTIQSREGDLQLMHMATEDVVVTKDAVISSKDAVISSHEAVISAKDQVIEQLQQRVDELVQAQAEVPEAQATTRFRWSLLNRLLVDQSEGLR